MGNVHLNPIADLIAEAKLNAVKAQEDKPCLTGRFIVVLRDSHEALRDRIAELEAEVERLTKELKAATTADDVHEALLRQVEVERAAALARAEKAERERDEARVALGDVSGRALEDHVRAARAEAREAGLRDALAAVVRERDEARESVKAGLPLIHELATSEAGLREALREVLSADSSSEETDTYGAPMKIADTILDADIRNRAVALAAAPAKNRPRRICLCGSTRFKRAWQEWNARLTIEGNVVLSVAIWSHAERLNLTPEQKATLDRVHLAKIDVADEVFVLDVGGYIGDGTRDEIAHAEKTGKPVRYLSWEFPAWTEADCEWWQDAAPAKEEGK